MDNETVRIRKRVEVFGRTYFVQVKLYRKILGFWIPVDKREGAVYLSEGIQATYPLIERFRQELLDTAQATR